MNKKMIIIVSAIAFVGGFLIFYQSRPAQQNAPADGPTSRQESTQKWETKLDEQADVTVVITPLDLSPRSAEWKFDIGMNTHAVELDQDMTAIATLIDDQGREYKPLSWDGAPPGGHHREGILTFSPITPTPKSVELKVTGIADVIRTFTWDVDSNLNK